LQRAIIREPRAQPLDRRSRPRPQPRKHPRPELTHDGMWGGWHLLLPCMRSCILGGVCMVCRSLPCAAARGVARGLDARAPKVACNSIACRYEEQGRSRGGAGKEQGRSTGGRGEEQGRSREEGSETNAGWSCAASSSLPKPINILPTIPHLPRFGLLPVCMCVCVCVHVRVWMCGCGALLR